MSTATDKSIPTYGEVKTFCRQKCGLISAYEGVLSADSTKVTLTLTYGDVPLGHLLKYGYSIISLNDSNTSTHATIGGILISGPCYGQSSSYAYGQVKTSKDSNKLTNILMNQQHIMNNTVVCEILDSVTFNVPMYCALQYIAFYGS